MAHCFLEARAEQLLRRLRVVRALQPHEKLSVDDDGSFDVDLPTLHVGVLRYLRGESRGRGLAALNATYDEISAIISTESDRHNRGAAGLRPLILDWLDELQQSLGGVATLLATYKDDVAAAGQLFFLHKRMTSFAAAMTTALTPAEPPAPAQ